MSGRLFPLMLAGALLCACSRTGQEKEPNDHFTQAGVLAANGRVSGTIATPGDVDVYKLSVIQERGILSLYLGGIRDVDFSISIQDKDRLELKRYDETGTGGDEEALDIGLSRGEFYVVLANSNPKAANPKQEYTLRAKLAAVSGSEREPNDTALAANLIELNGVTRGHYFPTRNLLAEDEEMTEADWFKLSVDKPGLYALNVDVSEVPKVDPILEVYDANAYKLKEIDNGGVGESESLRNFGVKGPAQLTLRLRPKARRSGNQDVAYELLTELLPYDGKAEFEPNDQRLDATPHERDLMTGNISPAGDADWYRVWAASESKSLLRADLTGLAGMDLQLTLASELGKPLMVIDNMGKEQPESLTGIAISGEHYLIVSEKSGKAADGRRAYTLARTLTPAAPGLELELNNSTASAQAIKVGESVDGYLAPKGDVDWYEFNVYKPGSVVFELTGVLNVRFKAAVVDQDNREIAAAAAAKAGESVSFDKELEAGTYWLRLEAAELAQNNVRDKYTLRLRMR